MSNTIHDMGGMHGFGPVEPEPDEPVFHAPWEGRVHALQRSIGAADLWTIDGGRASLEEIDASGAKGHLQGMTLFLYNPTSHQWSQTFASLSGGVLEESSVGRFKDGRGDFYDYEDINGRSILVRFSIWKTSQNTAQSEQAFSEDGGKTWEVNWINKYTR